MATKHLLIVDDKEDHRLVLADLLRSCGFRITTAESGKQALTQVSQDRIDVVITDFLMAEMNGLELIRAMARREWLVRTPVILLTANTREHLEVLADRAGAFCTVFKPVNFHSLLALIHSAMEQRRTVLSSCD